MLSLGIRSTVRQSTRTLTRSFQTSSRLLQQQQSNEQAKLDINPKDLSWVDFFKLRKEQRNINVVSSVFTALTGSFVSWGYISNIEIDPTQLIFGFDPFMIFFAGFMATTGVGYLFGPALGGVIFNLKNKSKLPLFNSKNKIFLEKITQNRVDPSSQSFSNPVPDYYGEKINSIKQYKQWLRDNNAYKRKTKEFL
ncbi:Presequence translocated-associated motor subunit PAM17, mitochondrial [Wickerhamomyces ciferrii]|uniref:Presequence translocated-associated motor subunit PAM17 n=1 Tax=Wickerhamomyces ciferrii (strain ATCC 14091 / BCRC 22168 / CBS 111 / JCM 3599 / NBRC 0793 / NRRL Y-1031 F-60-10) TaxID=1206466 RepID=K0KIH7_WICCF|nr:Presequence translocated-associated motor subunit PAM17, mitochondrial [Wickerhamomyces ciferrii]CCH45025.1 Presequence translocated-associated motor subunit PAM17, mitochondrial [Wickerhamomyces ciferrii]